MVYLSLLKSRRFWTSAVVAVFALVLLWYWVAYPRGYFMAYIDHARGHYEVKVYGEPPPPWVSEYERLLQVKYGVESNTVAGCVVHEGLVEYVQGYNSAMQKLLNEQHGTDIFEECARLAQIEVPNE